MAINHYRSMKLDIEKNAQLKKRYQQQLMLVEEVFRQNPELFPAMSKSASTEWMDEFMKFWAILRSIEPNAI